MNWKDIETWEEAAKQVADLIKKNERLELQLKTYRRELDERSYDLVRAIRRLQDEGINFDTHNLVKEVKAKAHASGELAELLSDEPNQKENDSE
jgi:hypothetical protein